MSLGTKPNAHSTPTELVDIASPNEQVNKFPLIYVGIHWLGISE